ncbi:hypothetical protein WHR41_04354 [Cladosporium halotolerans]|uniref:Uncharacterized protein n=1 Tax=Cladosporium halotolerans TaxID=1052096 RepID=A0AB34KTV2_9PEZI
MTRLPLTSDGLSGKAAWAVLLAIFHAQKPALEHSPRTSESEAEKGWPASKPRVSVGSREMDATWVHLPKSYMKQYQSSACVTISRTTFITLLCLTNARKAFQYSDSAGFRAGYASYAGQWHINWPIGQEAMVTLMPHDSHSTATDKYPLSYVQRVDGCVHMQAGIVQSRSANCKIAFCGRKSPGSYELRFVKKGVGGAHGSRHLYNMMGGKVFEVDLITAVPTADEDLDTSVLGLTLPGTGEAKKGVYMNVPADCEQKLKIALDCLPWNSLSWSMHRGMRDILLAYGRPVMGVYRSELASLVKLAIGNRSDALIDIGWDGEFVRSSMGDMAHSAIMAGSGDSEDLVRVVTDAVRILIGDKELDQDLLGLDDVEFWRLPEHERELDRAGIVALTKYFVLEWSIETDYQLYHQLPLKMDFG